jgi:hypothetical protein
MLLSRLVCTLLAPAVAAIGVVQRHVRLHTIGLLEVGHCFVALVVARLASQGPGATPSAPELLAALRAVLEIFVAIVNNVGCLSVESEAMQLVEATVNAILEAPLAFTDPAVLARLVLVFVRQPPGVAGGAAHLAAACSSLPEAYQALFWRQVRAQGTLCHLPGSEVQRLAFDWLSASGAAMLGAQEADMACVNDLADREVAHQHQEIDLLIEKCLREMPQSLKEMPLPSPRPAPDALTASPHVEQLPSKLSALDMPALPNQQPRADAIANDVHAKTKQRTKKLLRSDFGKIRGVDPATAPQELRCAIDGKILGNPLRSPYGHLFERDTLEHWMQMCGSVCPLTNQPLRLEDCVPDRAIEQQVLEWAKAVKAEHKRSVMEKREQRRLQTHTQELSESSCANIL